MAGQGGWAGWGLCGDGGVVGQGGAGLMGETGWHRGKRSPKIICQKFPSTVFPVWPGAMVY